MTLMFPLWLAKVTKIETNVRSTDIVQIWGIAYGVLGNRLLPSLKSERERESKKILERGGKQDWKKEPEGKGREKEKEKGKGEGKEGKKRREGNKWRFNNINGNNDLNFA